MLQVSRHPLSERGNGAGKGLFYEEHHHDFTTFTFTAGTILRD